MRARLEQATFDVRAISHYTACNYMQSYFEPLMVACFEKERPSIRGNDYLVIGMLDRSAWKESQEKPITSVVMEKVHPFKDMWHFEPMPSWYWE
jgi:hypothetical protein